VTVIRNTIHLFGEFDMHKDARLKIRWRSARVFVLGVIAGIVTVMFVGIPSSVNGMSGRPSVNPEQLENGDYLQKSDIDSRKILIKDKDDNVKGYLQKSYLDHRKMLIHDKDGKVKGYIQRDLMDSHKLKFVKE
jgi:hypothetical protein